MKSNRRFTVPRSSSSSLVLIDPRSVQSPSSAAGQPSPPSPSFPSSDSLQKSRLPLRSLRPRSRPSLVALDSSSQRTYEHILTKSTAHALGTSFLLSRRWVGGRTPDLAAVAFRPRDETLILALFPLCSVVDPSSPSLLPHKTFLGSRPPSPTAFSPPRPLPFLRTPTVDPPTSPPSFLPPSFCHVLPESTSTRRSELLPSGRVRGQLLRLQLDLVPFHHLL